MRSKLFIVALSLGAFTATAAAQSDVHDHRKNEVVPARRGAPPPAPAPEVRDHRKRSEPPPAPVVRDNRTKGRKGHEAKGRKDSVPGHNRRFEAQLKEQPLVSSFGPQQGKPGTAVTIRGRNFHDSTVIKVNGQQVPTRSISSRTIVFDVPRVKGEAAITLSYPGVPRDVVIGSFDSQAGGKAQDWKTEHKKRLSAAEVKWQQRRKQMTFEKEQAAREEARQQREAELAASREQRRIESRASIRANWEAAFLADPQTAAELALHAQRLAKLQRMLRIAESVDNGKVVARIEVSMETEGNRHESRMSVLKANFKVQ